MLPAPAHGFALFTSLLFAVLVLLAAMPAGSHAGAAGAGHAIPGHHIEATFGAAYHDDHWGSYTGLEYEYRFSEKMGVGAFADTTFDGFELAAYGVVANLHPAGRWKFVGGLGLERKIGGNKNKALFRLGAAYEFAVGNGVISPMVTYDFLEDAKDVIYLGAGLGFAF